MAAIIEFENVRKTLSGRKVLDGLTFSVEAGETFVIIGRSGTGKSVTLKHMVGLFRPDEGTVRVWGRDISALSKGGLEKIRNRFGYLFQDGALLKSMTVSENVALPLRELTKMKPDKIQQTVREKLALVAMAHAIDDMPDAVSGGMRKRAGLARAIVRDPEVILYDEPTSGLDPVMSSQINELIRDMQAKLKVTSIVVTHDMRSAYDIADRIAMLYNGKIQQTGTPDEIRNTADPVVRQFIEGETDGPLTDKYT
jgi:phospholipid/cholesterol/gamma-HCH transport system ATP-binding protein